VAEGTKRVLYKMRRKLEKLSRNVTGTWRKEASSFCNKRGRGHLPCGLVRKKKTNCLSGTSKNALLLGYSNSCKIRKANWEQTELYGSGLGE